MEKVDCIVIGAGVVGLAVARALAQRGLETVLLEREQSIGSGTSSRNSEVIHAGIYYAAGSLKAQLCVRGKHLLYEYCEQRGITHARCGKLIVATEQSHLAVLENLQLAARANGVNELNMISAATAQRAEPQLHCIAALESSSTGILDSHAFMLSLQGDYESAGGVLAFGSPLLGAQCSANGITVQVGGIQPMELSADIVVNCAGLHAQQVASSMTGLASAMVPPLYMAKGNYYCLTGRSPFSKLIYPVPEPGGLGVHLTIDLGGQARFGPDVEWVDRLAYDVDVGRSHGFYEAIRRYWPALPDGALQPGYAGVRPKLSGPGAPATDFVIQGPASHGVPGLVNLFGIESPGLTASLAIAEEVMTRL
ncbi:L-2-hydroxyglutarate oxidase LhgO [Herbaspirillum sp. Sphag1AN]|uniref:NAD(P)/FAD-dependent oxidoreductase n=1 Tax=unclassified Herbaspirillum TaxID=2624150 RepID=UPI00160E53BF|nr:MULTISPECIES: NAD(P)/FAD-dependent oxidoreductase [unclassified Herbaspirillum]MBB3212983.1 L-2-hydroxyglutarate oxidase LhgO [Herbaspirillum sp. Sphag1AN]MBB3246180.1 L-2-hydroxyglutarate oxidase LhgO [Herbaspirillum sp. Sphag64]